jgi:hypothetical protein
MTTLIFKMRPEKLLGLQSFKPYLQHRIFNVLEQITFNVL